MNHPRGKSCVADIVLSTVSASPNLSPRVSTHSTTTSLFPSTSLKAVVDDEGITGIYGSEGNDNNNDDDGDALEERLLDEHSQLLARNEMLLREKKALLDQIWPHMIDENVLKGMGIVVVRGLLPHCEVLIANAQARFDSFQAKVDDAKMLQLNRMVESAKARRTPISSPSSMLSSCDVDADVDAANALVVELRNERDHAWHQLMSVVDTRERLRMVLMHLTTGKPLASTRRFSLSSLSHSNIVIGPELMALRQWYERAFYQSERCRLKLDLCAARLAAFSVDTRYIARGISVGHIDATATHAVMDLLLRYYEAIGEAQLQRASRHLLTGNADMSAISNNCKSDVTSKVSNIKAVITEDNAMDVAEEFIGVQELAVSNEQVSSLIIDRFSDSSSQCMSTTSAVKDGEISQYQDDENALNIRSRDDDTIRHTSLLEAHLILQIGEVGKLLQQCGLSGDDNDYDIPSSYNRKGY